MYEQIRPRLAVRSKRRYCSFRYDTEKRGKTDKELRDEENCFSADTPCISSIQWRDSSALFCVSRASKDGAAMREKKKRKKELKRFFSREKCADPAQQKKGGNEGE